MKANQIKKWIYAASIVLGTAVLLTSYQNCSNDAGFVADPSVAQPFRTTNPPRIGGNENVVIRVNEYPGNGVKSDDPTVVDFDVSSPGEGTTITDVKCTLDGEAIDCEASDRVIIPGEDLDLGTHTFTIEGTNSNGETGSDTITWTIFSGITEKLKNLSVKELGDRADILINIDNSGSMEYEQESMIQRVSQFMDKFKNTEYHIMVTTTHPGADLGNDNAPYAKGRAIDFSSNLYCLKKGDRSDADNQNLLGQAVRRPESQENRNGSGYERGIYTTRLLLERVKNGEYPNCFRQNVAKHVILISDEDETVAYEKDSDGQPKGTPLFEDEKSDGNNLMSYVNQAYPGSAFLFHSIIVNPYAEEGRTCLDGEGAKYGTRYALLSLATGGEIGTVCAEDYASQLEDIGEKISDSAKTYPLGCVAVSNSGNNGSVTQGGVPIGIPYQFSGENIEFATNLPVGDYVVRFFCYE